MVPNPTRLQLSYWTSNRRSYANVDAPFEQVLVYKQLRDPSIIRIHKDLEKQESNKYELRNGVVYKKHNQGLLFYVPKAMIRNVIQACHDNVEHVGLEKTINLIIKTYWFSSMRVQVKEYIDNCLKYLSYSVPADKKEGELHIYDKGTELFDTIHINHYGRLKKETNS